ncbi:cell division cycle 20.4, cofactor of APC complex isoform X2 [Harmonia axyridis]|nr:cell division cycle 20.4, cofactor of APC complex isoform X2 [Harmonia axyridis]
MQYFYKKNQYKDVLASTLFQSPRRVLYFSPKQKARIDNEDEVDVHWPVKSRKKPLIQNPEYVCDMAIGSDYTNGTRQAVQWGPCEFITAALPDGTIYMHYPDFSGREFLLKLPGVDNVIQWNNEGDLLALSLKGGKIGICDVKMKKMVRTANWLPFKGKITYIVYTTDFLIIATTIGMIILWDHDLTQIISKCQAHKGIIFSAKLSCNENYLATNGDDSYIRIWHLPSMSLMFQVHCDSHPVMAIDWHPWKESVLSIGKSTRNSFCTLWDINKPENVHTGINLNGARVDCLAFNPNSAELVVGFWLDRPIDGKLPHNIVVQSNLNTVVDDMNFHSTRLSYLLWDKSGKRLASLGPDENLAIWNFFGKEKEKKYKLPIKETSIFKDNIYSIR